MTTIKSLALLLAFLSLSACISMPSVDLRVHLHAAKKINQDSTLAPLPVRVKLYQLTDVTFFNEATFRQLWKTDTQVLGSSLLNKRELTVNPGENYVLTMKRYEHAEYLAIVGVFRQHGDNHWKTVKKLPPLLLKPLTIRLHDVRVEIE